MAAVLPGDLSDEEWLVMRARACFKTDPYAAKSWMLTAQSLCPHSFNIQFEAYNLEKQSKNSKEAAKLLEGLHSMFPDNQRLWAEVHSILEALQKEAGDHDNSFLTEILAAIPDQVQCQMLLSVAEKIKDRLEQCRLLLLVLRKFPKLIKEHGLKLVDMLMAAESFAQFQSPVNCYRKLLVCDLLPLILQQKNSGLKVKAASLYLWLQKSVEFYISLVTTPPQASEPATPKSPDLLSPTKTSRRAKIAGLTEREGGIPHPWASLYRLLCIVGQKLGWDMATDFFEKSREFQWQQILGVYSRAPQTGGGWQGQQVLYTSTVLFLDCLFHYICSVDPDVFNTAGSSAVPLVIVEGFKCEQLDVQPPAKRLKAESLLPQVHATDSVPGAQKVIQDFLTAFKCYELLNSTAEMQQEFVVLCRNWRMETWSWMSHFQTDMFLYQGAFPDAIRHLQNYSIGSKSQLQIRHSLQLACFYYCLNNYTKACELSLDVIAALPVTSPESSDVIAGNQFTFSSGRHLVLAPCTGSQMIPYCIQMLLACFKEKAFGPKSSDIMIGHTLVLLQYEWSTNIELFNLLIKKIQKQGSFSFNLFFSYIINIDILEEFSFIKTAEGGKVTLDVLPLSTATIAQQRTVTRGVNKGVTEDFKVMMEKQVRRCDEPIESIIREYLLNERPSIMASL